MEIAMNRICTLGARRHCVREIMMALDCDLKCSRRPWAFLLQAMLV